VEPKTRDALVERLSRFETLVEVGIGRRTDIAAALADAGRQVYATDLHPREVPDGVTDVCDDVTDPASDVYARADAIYALNLPPELHRPVLDVAREHDVPFYFTTLGADQPAVPVERETLPGETLFLAR
jgi:uncharacterized UPF0146 family protein